MRLYAGSNEQSKSASWPRYRESHIVRSDLQAVLKSVPTLIVVNAMVLLCAKICIICGTFTNDRLNLLCDEISST